VSFSVRIISKKKLNYFNVQVTHRVYFLLHIIRQNFAYMLNFFLHKTDLIIKHFM